MILSAKQEKGRTGEFHNRSFQIWAYHRSNMCQHYRAEGGVHPLAWTFYCITDYAKLY